jgi:predicted ribosome quality control (RQC) complex YloA/Tae2 family protein
MNTRTITISTILLCGAACAPLEPVAQPQQEAPRAAPVIQARSNDADLLLAYFESTRSQSKDEYKAELAGVQRRFAASPNSSFIRTQLALLLSAPHADPRDVIQALKLLEDVSKDAQVTGSLKNLASVLQSYLTFSARQEENVASLSQRVKEERKRADQVQAKQDGSTQALEQKLKDEQKKSEGALAKQEENIQQLTLRLRDEQKRAEDLQAKLDAILKIERSLIERQQQSNGNTAPKEATKEAPKDATKEASKETKDAKDSKETAKDAAKEAPKDAPKDVPKEPK